MLLLHTKGAKSGLPRVNPLVYLPDGIGEMRLGPATDPIAVDFALEAKLYNHEIGDFVGVGDTKRLISRLRHRQFGVFVTTSALSAQAYREIRDDGHPVVVLAAQDIVNILAAQGKGTASDVLRWLQAEFPLGSPGD